MGDSELERFKTDINLIELASCYGYECVKKESSRSSVVMRHSDGDKIVCATAPDGHGIFFSVRPDGCGGSVIDFVMHREAVQLGRARQFLRKYLSKGYLQAHSSVHYRPQAVPTGVPDLYARWLRMQSYQGGYLESRGISDQTIALFADRIRIDERGNVAFRHDDLHSFAGWELKNKGFTGFCAGGKKALFGCKVGTLEDVPLIVIAECAVDALSYYQLKPRPGFYLSFAGTLSQAQKELLIWVLNRYQDADVVIATDNDEAGRAYAQWLCSVRAEASVDCPLIGKDWNDVLMNREVRR